MGRQSFILVDPFSHYTRNALPEYCLGDHPSTILPSLWDSCDVELHRSNP